MDLLSKLQITNVYRLMILALLINYLFNFQQFGLSQTIPILLVSVLTAFTLDSIILYLKYKRFVFSDSAIISGLFISLILNPIISAATTRGFGPVFQVFQFQPFYIYVFAATIAILSKHIIGFKGQHLFNPAMFGIFITSFIFGVTLSWWGASSLIAVLAMGLLVNYQFKRFNQSLVFLATYAVLTLLFSFFNPLITTAELFNPVLYFFAFFMFIEPRTSPQSKNNRTIYGLIGGIIVFLSVVYLPLYNFAAGLLISNIFVKILDKFKK